MMKGRGRAVIGQRTPMSASSIEFNLLPDNDSEFDALFPTGEAVDPALLKDALSQAQGPLPDSLLPHLGETRLSPSSHARLQLTEALQTNLLRAMRLHPELDPALLTLRPLLAEQALLSPSWLLQNEHPLRRMIRRWLDSARGWQPELGRAAEQQLQTWCKQFASLLEAENLPAACERLITEMEVAEQRELQRLQRLEERLHATERGQLQARRTRALAARILNQSLGGRKLPAGVNQFLHEEWFRCLQQLLLRHGEHSDIATELNELTRQLVWSLQPQARDDEHLQQLYQVVPDLAEQLRQHLSETLHDANRLDQLLGLIEHEHLKQLRGENLAAQPCVLIANNDPILSAQATVSRPLLRQVESLELGQWFWVADGDFRMRLSLKLTDTAQLLFVNALGVKAAVFSFEEFAYRLANGDARPVPGGEAMDALIRQLLERGVQAARQRLHQRQLAEREARERQEAEAKRRAEARAKALAEAKAQAEAEANAKAAEEQAAREQEQTRREQRLDQLGDESQRERAARQLASAIDIGAWVEFFDEFGTSRRLKLAVKLPSSGKLIFVDRDGGNKLEVGRTDFIAQLLTGSAQLLEQAAAFDDTLAKVVNGLRRDRSQGGSSQS